MYRLQRRSRLKGNGWKAQRIARAILWGDGTESDRTRSTKRPLGPIIRERTLRDPQRFWSLRLTDETLVDDIVLASRGSGGRRFATLFIDKKRKVQLLLQKDRTAAVSYEEPSRLWLLYGRLESSPFRRCEFRTSG